jgi:predicted phosphodiesterase
MDAIVISDIHGYLDEAQTVLRDTGVINKEGEWIGGKSRLIVLGDLVDRGPKSLETYQYFRSLQEQLGEDQVEILLGNHDIQYVGGPEAGYEPALGKDLSKLMREDSKSGKLKFATTVESGGETWLCVHGGYHPRLELGETPEEVATAINSLGDEFLRENIQHPEIVGVGYQRVGSPRIATEVLSRLDNAPIDEKKKVWISSMHPLKIIAYLEHHGFIDKNDPVSTQRLAQMGVYQYPGVTWCDVIDDLELYAQDLMPQIVGHRQQMDGINLRCQNKTWAINVPYGDAQALIIGTNQIHPSRQWKRNLGELVQPVNHDLTI